MLNGARESLWKSGLDGLKAKRAGAVAMTTEPQKHRERISITVKPTNDCNMRCKHCYHAEEGFQKEMISPESVKKMFDVAIKDYDDIFVVFHGGEPTLWGVENLIEVLEYQQELEHENPSIKFRNSIQTNGVLLDESWIKTIQKYNIVVGVSFDGPHNDDLRSNTDLVYHNMVMMKEAGIPFGVLCVESGKSIINLESTYEWFKKEGFNFKVLALFMSGNALDHKELELNIDQYVDKLTQVYQKWLYDQECNISMRTFEDFLKISDRMYCIQYGGSCIYKRICINPDGKIYPCGRPYTEDFILGHIDTLERISDAYATPGYKRLAGMGAARAKQCMEHCKYYGICRGGCISSAILEGSFEKIDNTTCVRAKKLLSRVTAINDRVFGLYDNGKDLDRLNPRALHIMKKSRAGEFSFMNRTN